MEVIGLQVFVSLALGACSVVLFLISCRARDYDHADRLALLPLESDAKTKPEKR
jgi:cbb3-type cytochrome oxidase maturation protein